MTARYVIETLGVHIAICIAFFGVFGIVGFAYSVNSTLGAIYFFWAIGSLLSLAYSLTFFAGSVAGMILLALIWSIYQTL